MKSLYDIAANQLAEQDTQVPTMFPLTWSGKLTESELDSLCDRHALLPIFEIHPINLGLRPIPQDAIVLVKGLHLYNSLQYGSMVSYCDFAEYRKFYHLDAQTLEKVPAVIQDTTYCTREQFDARWRTYTGNIFDGFSWEHVVAAGGSMVSALQQSSYVHDIDLFFHGLGTMKEVVARAKEVIHWIHRRSLELDYNVKKLYINKSVVSLLLVSDVMPWKKKQLEIQLILSPYENPHHLLSDFDIPPCKVAYDGKQVWMTQDGFQAWKTRSYFIQPLFQQRSVLTRVLKYAKRGFSCLTPGIQELPEICQALFFARDNHFHDTLQALLLPVFSKTGTSNSTHYPAAGYCRVIYTELLHYLETLEEQHGRFFHAPALSLSTEEVLARCTLAREQAHAYRRV